jgi:cytochrome oxidase assembly protein ShyY1
VRRLPVLPTILVGLAAAAMVALGIWQLHRKAWKEGLLARYSANESLPPIAFPGHPFGDALLFRKAHAVCADVTGWTTEVGRSASGQVGWRQIARCTRAGTGEPFAVQLGGATHPDAKPSWTGGPVSGFISHAPDHRALIETMLGEGGPKELMLVAKTPPQGLMPNSGPDLSAVPNNHLAYAVQWFIFAGLAVVIYLLALRRRTRPLVTPPTRG